MLNDKEFVAAVAPAIRTAWQEIACDAMQLEGPPMTNAGAMELCIDAGRLTTCGRDKKADALVNEYITAHGYRAVAKLLCKHIKLIG